MVGEYLNERLMTSYWNMIWLAEKDIHLPWCVTLANHWNNATLQKHNRDALCLQPAVLYWLTIMVWTPGWVHKNQKHRLVDLSKNRRSAFQEWVYLERTTADESVDCRTIKCETSEPEDSKPRSMIMYDNQTCSNYNMNWHAFVSTTIGQRSGE